MEERRARSSSAKPLEFALRRLARRSHGTGELSDKMARAGYGPEEIEATIVFLRERGYLNDSAFAREVARAGSERKLWGPARIENKLRVLRIGKEEIAGAIRDAFPEGEEEAASRALSKFLKRRRRSGDRARAYRHLLARGFSPEVSHRLVSARNFEDTGRS